MRSISFNFLLGISLAVPHSAYSSNMKNLKKDIQWNVEFSYGQDYEDAANKVPVLIMESHFKNLSPDQTYTLSFWGSFQFLKSILPSSAFKTFPVTMGVGMPGAPKKDQLVEIKPGATYTYKQWYWAQETLPWRNEGGSKGYVVSKAQALELIFTTEFKNDAEVFKNQFHLKNLQCDVGVLISQPVKLDFKIYSPEESRGAIKAEEAPKLMTNLEAFAAFQKNLLNIDDSKSPRVKTLKTKAEEIQKWLSHQKIVGSNATIDPQNISAPIKIKLFSVDSPEIKRIENSKKQNPKAFIVSNSLLKIKYLWKIEFVNYLHGGYSILLNAESGDIVSIQEMKEG